MKIEEKNLSTPNGQYLEQNKKGYRRVDMNKEGPGHLQATG